MSRAIGIDFGTSTSLAAEGDPLGGTTLAPLGRASTYLPSLLGITDAALVAGDAAGDLPERQIVRSIKRQITERGTTIPDPLHADATIDVDDAIVTVLRALAQGAREFFQLDAGTVRLGCPAMWDADQRSRLIRLAQRAGIPATEYNLIDEPIAAGMAWLSHRVRDHSNAVRGRVLVFDMGGGTLDVALLHTDTKSGRNGGEISVLASKGINKAGDDLDLAIRADLVAMIENLDLDLDAAARAEIDRRILTEARLTKIMLSTEDEAMVRIPLESRRLPTLRYTREQLEMVFAGQLDEAESLVWNVVKESHLTHEVHHSPEQLRAMSNSDAAQEIKHVLLAGGMSQIPAVRARLERMFPRAEFHDKVGRNIGPDEAIAAGLAETTSYDRVNLHRPSFDFLLEVPDGPTLTLYSAHSPLYESWQATQQSDLYYQCTLTTRQLPNQGIAQLRARSSMGDGVTFRLAGADQAGIPVQLGHEGVRFCIRPNGRITLTDGKGHQHMFRVDRWPVLRGRDHAFIQLEALNKQPAPTLESSHTQKEYDGGHQAREAREAREARRQRRAS